MLNGVGEMLKSVSLGKGMQTIVDDEDADKVNQYDWYLSGAGYPHAWMGGKKVMLHRFLLDVPSGFEVDHINRDKLDNRRNNLRIVTHQQNNMNKPGRSLTSKYKGVGFHHNG